jgi:hypothetical protein
VPARITMALDAIGAEGPWVDEALGGVEPMVDDWEAGKYLPTDEQVKKLAALTGRPEAFFYRPCDELREPMRVFLCDMRRRGENGLTIIESHVDWDGVLHREQLTPDRPPYRPRKAPPKPPRRLPKGVHEPVDDPDAPGCCQVCRLPLDKPNRRHP